MSGWIVRCTRLWLLACIGILFPINASAGKQVDIEETYRYIEHSVTVISAHPRESDNGPWTHSHGLIKDPDGRVQAVWVEVRAQSKGLLGSAVRVRARLTVTLEEQVSPPGPTGGAPTPPESPGKVQE